MNITLLRVLRGIGGAVVLLILFLTVSNWMGDYRTSRAQSASVPTETVTPSREETAKPEEKAEQAKSSKDAAPKRKMVVVLTNGLNFRESPTGTSNRIRALDKGEKLIYLKKESGWYQVQDEDGTKGWVSARPDYTKVQ